MWNRRQISENYVRIVNHHSKCAISTCNSLTLSYSKVNEKCSGMPVETRWRPTCLIGDQHACVVQSEF